MLLADLGATVVKIESPAGDETRHYKPPILGEDSTYYLSLNRNKRSIVLDLTNPTDLDTAQRIAHRADVVSSCASARRPCRTAGGSAKRRRRC
jgi:crotonobetainyl-CoA:carnitine CoA-transferase CaiB-like acyl-CoA transferase